MRQLKRYGEMPEVDDDFQPPADAETLECGCVYWTVGEVFYIKPCSLTCSILEFVQEESAKKGNPTLFRYEGSAAG